jgi:uncharacterized protein
MQNKKLQSKKTALWVLLAVLGAITGAVAYGRMRLRRYAVRRIGFPLLRVSEETPAHFDMLYEEITFLSRDGLKLHGWFIPTINNDPAQPTIIIAHGYSSNKSPDLPIAHFLHRAGYKVFMFDFRGHGRSEGPRGTSLAFMERLDVHGAVDYLLGRGERRIGMLGTSMGGAIGIIATAENPFIAALIADSPFAYLWKSISAEMRNINYPNFITDFLAKFAYKALCDYHGYSAKIGNPASFVGKIAPRPIFFIHGELDNLTTVANTHILYELANEPKQKWILPEFGHTEVFTRLPREFEERVLDFFARVNWADPYTELGQNLDRTERVLLM